jgi:hypothetical protein
MKSILTAVALAAVAALSLPASVLADDLAAKWAGSYSSKETNFVTLKRITIAKAKDGSIKLHGALVGFPDEVSIGEATTEPYADRNNKQTRTRFWRTSHPRNTSRLSCSPKGNGMARTCE